LNSSFDKSQIWELDLTLGSSFRHQLCGATFRNHFGEYLWGVAPGTKFKTLSLWGNRFTETFWGIILALRRSFGQFSGIILQNNYFEE